MQTISVEFKLKVIEKVEEIGNPFLSLCRYIKYLILE